MASQDAAPQAAACTTRTFSPLPAEFNGLARLAAGACQAPLASIVVIGWGEAWSGSDAGGAAHRPAVAGSFLRVHRAGAGGVRCAQHSARQALLRDRLREGQACRAFVRGMRAAQRARGGPGSNRRLWNRRAPAIRRTTGGTHAAGAAMRDANRTSRARGRTRAALFGAACDGAAPATAESGPPADASPPRRRATVAAHDSALVRG